MKKIYLLLVSCFCLLFCTEAFSQSKIKPLHVGVYQGSLITQVAIGTDFEKKYFGELRLNTTDLLDFPFSIEGNFNRNLKRTDWYNIHLGLMLRVWEFGDLSAGLPLGLTIKPIEAHRNLGILLETTPVVSFFGNVNLRGVLGVRYSFGN